MNLEINSSDTDTTKTSNQNPVEGGIGGNPFYVEAEDITKYEEGDRPNMETKKETTIDSKSEDQVHPISISNSEIEASKSNHECNVNSINEPKGYIIPPEVMKFVNTDYFDEHGIPKYDELVKYENEIRAEVEQTSPLVSEKLSITCLEDEFKASNFENSISTLSNRYESIRTTRRDGNCFYRSYLFRLFEELAIKKSKNLHDHVVKTVETSKALAERHGYQWTVFEDFYNVFYNEWEFVYQLDPSNAEAYM